MKKFFKIAISLILVGYILSRIDLGKSIDIFLGLDLGLYLIIIIVFLFGVLISSLRWGNLLRVQKIRVKMTRLFKYYLFGFVMNFAFPTNIGGDGYKVYKIIGETKENKTGAVLATIFDRALGLFALFLIIFVSLPFVYFYLNVPFYLILIPLSAVFCLLVFVFVFYLLRGERLDFLIASFFEKFDKKQLYFSIKKSVNLYSQHKKTLLKGLLFSLFFHILGILNQYLCFRAIDVDVPLLILFLVVPVVRLITVLPISIGGIGVTETALIFLLGGLGISSDQIIAHSAVIYSMTILVITSYLIYIFLENILKFFRK